MARNTPPSQRTEWEVVDAALALYLTEAQTKRDSAGYAGEWGDGGASRMEEQVADYKSGRMNEIPTWLVRCYSKVKAQRDPDFDEYQRLKKKFEGTV
jgi:hypothetical protein